MIWNVTGAEYNTSQGYINLQNMQGSENKWNVLWSIKVPPSIKLFMWKVIHEKLPTLNFLHERGILIDPTCPWCESDVE